jgi:hypothetical protein
MRRTTRLTALVVFISALFASIGGVAEAQVPTLDPEKTVNLATGEMSFALQLGVVKGINGHDFPINLYYQAGIRLDQPASPVGLRFSYSPGTITRQIILVPDCNSGGPNNYDSDLATTILRGLFLPDFAQCRI